MAFLDDEDDIEHAVEAWAKALGILDQKPRSAVDALSAMKFGGHIAEYIVLPDAQMPTALGQYDAASRRIFLRQSTMIGANQNIPASRWVVFEEVAHAALRHTGERHFSTAKSLAETHSPKVKREEAEAKRFAAAMMAPYSQAGYSSAMSAVELTKTFAMPPRAAEIRLEELGRIDRRRNRTERRMPQVALDFLAKPKAKPPQYEGDPCPNPNCGKMQMVRIGVVTECLSCGTRLGAD